LHTDSQAAKTAKSLRARAFTVVFNVVFGTGQYRPETLIGQYLTFARLASIVDQVIFSGTDTYLQFALWAAVAL
jgi:hypothetical protein